MGMWYQWIICLSNEHRWYNHYFQVTLKWLIKIDYWQNDKFIFTFLYFRWWIKAKQQTCYMGALYVKKKKKIEQVTTIKRSKSWKPSFKKKKKKDVSWGCVMPIDLGGKDVSKREQQKTIKKERHWYCMGPHKSAWRARCGVACLVSITAFLNTNIILFSITKKRGVYEWGMTTEFWWGPHVINFGT
jgi:hypothetical protein